MTSERSLFCIVMNTTITALRLGLTDEVVSSVRVRNNYVYYKQLSQMRVFFKQGNLHLRHNVWMTQLALMTSERGIYKKN